MRPDPAELAGLWDIHAAARRGVAFVGSMALADFARDEKTYYAVIAQLQIIGEATKRLPAHIRERVPHVPWREMARMRDWLIHHYDRIRPDIVYDTVMRDLPFLIAEIEPHLHGDA